MMKDKERQKRRERESEREKERKRDRGQRVRQAQDRPIDILARHAYAHLNIKRISMGVSSILAVFIV